MCLKARQRRCIFDIRRREFQYFGAETENDLSYKEVRNLGTINVPSTDDLSVRTRTGELGVSIFVIYSGARSFRALYVRVALL